MLLNEVCVGGAHSGGFGVRASDRGVQIRRNVRKRRVQDDAYNDTRDSLTPCKCA